MKTGTDALGTVENESGIAKNENGTRRPTYLRKHVRQRKTRKRDLTPSGPPKKCPGAKNQKTGLDGLGTAKTESERLKHENGTPHPPYRRKRVWERKT
jgi:hypothetical protein